MNPEIAWRHERENIDQLLARMVSDPDFRTSQSPMIPRRRSATTPTLVSNDMPARRSVDPLKQVALPDRPVARGRAARRR